MMATHPFLPRKAFLSAKKKTSSSHAKARQFSLANETSAEDIRYHSYKIEAIGNQGNQHSKKNLQQANSVYNLPSTEEAIKLMHAVCGYLVKSSWPKAVKARNYISLPLLTERNVNKYYPETTETPKEHMNQTRTNMRSTKPKPTTWEQLSQSPLEEPNTSQLTGKKV